LDKELRDPSATNYYRQKKNIARRKLLKKVEKPIEGKRDTMEMGFWGRMADKLKS
jgi:hypothetical protein